MKLFTSVLVILIYTDPLEMAGQNEKSTGEEKDVVVMLDEQKQTADILFSAPENIHDLLIVVCDKAGQTVFLDNKNDFKGNYKNKIDFHLYGKGEYSIKVKTDKNEFNKQFVIH